MGIDGKDYVLAEFRHPLDVKKFPSFSLPEDFPVEPVTRLFYIEASGMDLESVANKPLFPSGAYEILDETPLQVTIPKGKLQVLPQSELVRTSKSSLLSKLSKHSTLLDLLRRSRRRGSADR